MGELVKTLSKLDSAGTPMTFGQLVAGELIGEPLADRIISESWRSFVTVQVKLGSLRADLPVSNTSLVHGLTDQGRDVIARFTQLSGTAGR
jgi:hypothetical protein